MGNHAPVVAGDDDAAAAGGLLLVDKVFSAETSFLTGRVKGVGILVGANAADIDNGVGGENVLLVGWKLDCERGVKETRRENSPGRPERCSELLRRR